LTSGESPYSAFVPFERTDKFTGEGTVDVDGVVVRGGDDTIVGEEETCDDRGTMCGEANVFWRVVFDPAGAC
jgi:hypothetical protein